MITKAIILFLLSTFKYAMTIPPIVFYFNYAESLIISLGGGLFGIFFFRFVWQKILFLWRKLFIKGIDKSDVVKITKRKRYLVKIKNKYGFWGVIILTPVFLSIPLGVFILQRYFRLRKYKFTILSAALIIWGTILITFFHFIRNLNYFGL